MKLGAGVSGGAHLALIAMAILSGALFSDGTERPVSIAEVTLMSGAEFEAAQSAAPEFNANLPAAPEAPNPGDERADVKVTEEDAAPTTQAEPAPDVAPTRGEVVEAPPEEAPSAAIADVGAQPAGPPAPEADTLVAASDSAPEIAPVAETPIAPAPAPRPAAPQVEATTPEPPAAESLPVEAAEQEPAPTPEPEAQPEPEPKVAEASPTPVEETEPEKLNDPDIPAPKLSPPPPTKPRDIAEAKKAERLAREARPPEETGAKKAAEAPSGGGTTQTVGQLSFRDRDALRVGIKSYFNPPPGGANPEQLRVKLRIEVSEAGKIIAGPEVLEPSGRLDAQHEALKRAGVRALKQSELAGVFARLPKDRYARWRVMNVIFTPREIQFL
ncbi:hypothetical protein G5B40_07455 [Pikeienuella piscinae]|uniref:Cell envelope biogenesis protein TolA n=1 Tax=Pikeienuella piscinae TaxID=2748098 RepID=A0A7L5BZK7_9RHOB|nr:hypothetical protein [Pikeienuella piscinae]QIE55304.1 hypothetical protein G5B40_07455 [Pikeienuella piscinae]